MRILFLGDIVGKPGRKAVIDAIPQLRRDLSLDLVLANAENASGGVGLNAKEAADLLNAGLDLLTTGNHVWRHKDIYPVLDANPRVIRPANYPPGAPGRGMATIATPFGPVTVLNLLGRVYMDPVDCPFVAAKNLLASLPPDHKIRLVDFHAEATSEKQAMGYYLDGQASAVLGTHTHVQTSDAHVLPGHTAYITDLGMSGPQNSILGMDKDIIVRKFITGLPARFEVADTATRLEGAILDIDPATGHARSIHAYRS